MQLKRDTDYALRLILSTAEYAGENGISLPEMCKQATVPRTIASRLCPKLVGAELLKERCISKQPVYFLGDDVHGKTLLDVVLATEETVDMFAVFDHCTELYTSVKDEFESTEQKLIKSLSEVNLHKLIKKNHVAG